MRLSCCVAVYCIGYCFPDAIAHISKPYHTLYAGNELAMLVYVVLARHHQPTTSDGSLMSCRLPMCHQTNLRFYDDIAYEKQYKGLILDGFEGHSLLVYHCIHTVFHVGVTIFMSWHGTCVDCIAVKQRPAGIAIF